MKRTSRAVLGALATAALTATVALTLTTPAQAATWQQVSGFGSNPGNLNMHLYQPTGLPAAAPVVVALHGCTQNAATYHANSGWRELADQWDFTLVYPEQRSANNTLGCFHWFETADTARGQGEALSIAQMVEHATTAYGADAGRVYVTGLSAGGAMAAAMLATYPDVFAGGSTVAGLPYRCAPPNSTTMCQYAGVSRPAAQWGDEVRAAHPGYNGPRPKVAIWHGTSDSTVTPTNATELTKQWTDVAGVSTDPTSTANLAGGTTLERYGDDQVRRYSVSGMGHGQPVAPGEGCGATGAYFLDAICAAAHDAEWFGLDGGGPSPTPTASPTASPTATPSAPPSPTTSPTPPTCVTSNNYAHTQAGRAYQSGGYAYAAGSDQNMGLWNVFVTTTLQRTGPDHWVVGC